MTRFHECTMDDLDVVLSTKILGPFTEQTERAMRLGIDKTGRDMVKRTRGEKDGETYKAPVDGGKWRSRGFPPHREGGTFLAHIALARRGTGARHQAIWYVKSPEYRLAHLLANGHELYVFGRKAGKRTKADPFLKNARDKAAAEVMANIIRRMPR